MIRLALPTHDHERAPGAARQDDRVRTFAGVTSGARTRLIGCAFGRQTRADLGHGCHERGQFDLSAGTGGAPEPRRLPSSLSSRRSSSRAASRAGLVGISSSRWHGLARTLFAIAFGLASALVMLTVLNAIGGLA